MRGEKRGKKSEKETVSCCQEVGHSRPEYLPAIKSILALGFRRRVEDETGARAAVGRSAGGRSCQTEGSLTATIVP